MMGKITFGQQEPKRIRLGMVFLAAGIVLVLWAWGSWIYRASTTTAVPPSVRVLDNHSGSVQDESPVVNQTEAAGLLPVFLMFGFILVIVFLVGSYVLVRTTRRYRAGLTRTRSPPTDTSDVWSMHQLPHDEGHDE